MKNLINILILAIVFSITAVYENTDAQWIQNYNGPGNGMDFGNSIITDGIGNVYVVGSIQGSQSEHDITTLKYNSIGERQWVQFFNGTGNFNDYGRSIALDDLGNVFVSGSCNEIGSGEDFITMKYNSSGVIQWIQKYNGPGNNFDAAYSMVVDKSGNIYVAGITTGLGTGNDYILFKYDSNGNPIWMRTYNGTGNGADMANDVALDISGNVYISGTSMGIGTDFDYALIKYDSSGVLKWVQRFNGISNSTDQPSSLEVDGHENIYLTGFSERPGTSFDFATIKYNSNGDSQWVNFYNGTGNSYDQSRSIAVDNSGNVYITGGTNGGETGEDFTTIKYDSTGDQKWVRIYAGWGGDINDNSSAVGVDASGNVYVTGNSYPNYNTNVLYTIKYSSTGIQQWIQKNVGVPHSMEVDSAGNVFITGEASGIGILDLTIIKISNQISREVKINSLLEGHYNSSTDNNIEDTICIFLRNTIIPYYTIADSAKVVLDSNGQAIIEFTNAVNDIGYILTIKHRNSVETWGSQQIMFQGNQLSYDFTTDITKAFGNNLVLKGNKYCIYSGDVNQDGSIDLTDVLKIFNDAKNISTGYLVTDVTGDNLVDLSDLTLTYNNSSTFVAVKKP